MKLLKLALLLLVVLTFSCKEKKASAVINENSTKTVEHYTCPDKCEKGGAAAAGNCKVCNKVLIHNQAWHNDEFLKSGPLNVPAFDGTKNTNQTSGQKAPAQNALGIFHYTCNNGCSGGAGSTAKCKSCGSDLAHNAAYHTK